MDRKAKLLQNTLSTYAFVIALLLACVFLVSGSVVSSNRMIKNL